MENKCPHKTNSKEYFAWHSRRWFKQKKEDNPQWYKDRKLYRTAQRQNKKTKYVKKFGSVCLDCEREYIDCVFEFHHIDPKTKIHADPSKVFMFSDKRIEEELNKCVMLCANCHRIRHHTEKYSAHEKRKQ